MADISSKPRLESTSIPDDDSMSWSSSPETTAVLGYVASLAMTTVATAMAVGIDSQVTIPNLSLLFVVPVVVAAVSFGLGPSVCSAILGALAYNFFLTEPRYSLAVDDPANIWAIVLLFIVGLIVSTVAFTSRRRATEAALLRRQVTTLQNYSREVVAAENTESIVSITAQALAALFQVPVVLLLMAEGNIISREQIGGADPSAAELEAARSSLAAQTVVRAGVYPDTTSRYDFWPVTTAIGPGAIIGLMFHPDDRPSAPAKLVDVVGSVLTLVLERQHSRAGV